MVRNKFFYEAQKIYDAQMELLVEMANNTTNVNEKQRIKDYADSISKAFVDIMLNGEKGGPK